MTTFAHIADGSSASSPATVTNGGWGTDTRAMISVAAALSSGTPTIAVSGGGVTWSSVVGRDYASRRYIQIFQSNGTPNGGDLTITVTGGTLAELAYELVEAAQWSGTDPLCSFSNNNNTAGATSLSVSAISSVDAGDKVYAALGVESGSASALAVDIGSLLHTAYTGGTDIRAFVAADAEEDSTPGFTWTTSSAAGMVAACADTGATGTHGGGGGATHRPIRHKLSTKTMQHLLGR